MIKCENGLPDHSDYGVKKDKGQIYNCIFSEEEHSVLQILPHSSFLCKERTFSALALFGFVPYCWLLGQCYIPEFHATPFTFTIPSLPNFMPVGFHSTINLLFSMEMSGNQWGNPPLASAGYFFAALCLQWTWQSYCSGTGKWMELGAIQMAPESAETSFSLTSVSIGLGPPKQKVCCFLSISACDSG